MLCSVFSLAATGTRAARLWLAALALLPGTRARGAPNLRLAAQDPGLPQEFARGEDLSASGLVALELRLSRGEVLLGESLELRLHLEIEREFLGGGLVQLFQRSLDLPVQVLAPALEGLEGLRYLDELERPNGASFALGERVTRAERAPDLVRDGRTFAVFEFARHAQARAPGSFELGAPVLVCAHATRFEDDFLQGRRPLDRREAFVRGAAARLTVEPPPEEGRPPEFTGAIGAFTLEATATPQDLRLGESLELTLRIRAADAGADLAHCDEPRLELPEWLHSNGSLVEREVGVLTARYDLVPLREGALELPPVRFAAYATDPPAGYRTLETAPIPIVVRARAGVRSASTPSAPGLPSEKPASVLVVIVLLGGAALVVLVVLVALGIAHHRRAP